MNSIVVDTNILVYITGTFAHQTEEQKIITSGKGYYLTYFPELTIITTDSRFTVSLFPRTQGIFS